MNMNMLSIVMYLNLNLLYLHLRLVSSIVELEVHYTKYVDALELDDEDRTSQWKRATQR